MKSQFRSPTEKVVTPDEALTKLEQFCAYRERSPVEVHQKLMQLGVTSEIANQILQVLKEDNFLDEVRFAESFSRGKFRINEWGKVRIRLELQRQGISESLIEQALAKIPNEEYWQILKKNARKKWNSLSDETNIFQKKAKVGRFLTSCGFEQDLIFEAIDQISTAENQSRF